MMHNVHTATRETHGLSLSGSMAYDAANGGSQTVPWESDAVIVPLMPGNAGVGKDVHTIRPWPRDTFTIHRDR